MAWLNLSYLDSNNFLSYNYILSKARGISFNLYDLNMSFQSGKDRGKITVVTFENTQHDTF